MVLRQRWIWGAAAFVLVLVPLVILVIRLPNLYRGAATVLIERQQIPEDIVRSPVSAPLEVRLQTISPEVLSRSRLEEMIARFGLYEDDKRAEVPTEQIIEQMREDVKLELIGTDKEAPTEQIIEEMREDVEIELKGADRTVDRATVAFTVTYQGVRCPEGRAGRQRAGVVIHRREPEAT